MLYFGLSRILFIEDELSHYENERRAIFCILNLSYLIYDSVSESFQFINTTDLVRVALDFDKTAVNQSISCRTDDPNASTTLFFNFQELPVGGRISLDKQVYTIYGVKKTDAGYYQCKATSSQGGVGSILSEITVFIVQEGKWLSCLLVPITGQCMWKRGISLCTPRGYSYNDTGMTHSIYLHIFLCICLHDTKKNISFLYKSSSSWFSFPLKNVVQV